MKALSEAIGSSGLSKVDKHQGQLGREIDELQEDDAYMRQEIAEQYSEARSYLFGQIIRGVSSGSLSQGYSLGRIDIDYPHHGEWEVAHLVDEPISGSVGEMRLTYDGHESLRREVYAFIGAVAPNREDFVFDETEPGPGAIVSEMARKVTSTNLPGVYLVEERARLQGTGEDTQTPDFSTEIVLSLHDAAVPDSVTAS